VYLGAAHSDDNVGEVAGVAACCVVAPECAVALELIGAESFAASARAGVGMLQSSRRVHLRSGEPIVGIAWVHCLVKPVSVQVDLPSVDK
jgi:hypothetical protein